MPTNTQEKIHARHPRLGHALCREAVGEMHIVTPHPVLVTCKRCLKLLTAQQLAKRKKPAGQR